jgi:hypothetical protein
MHGSIELTSTPAVGSTATFTLPLKVFSWLGEVPIARPSSETQLLARSLPRGSTHRDILNQQISEIVTSNRAHSHPIQDEKKKAGEAGGGLNALNPDQRSRINILLVEDK